MDRSWYMLGLMLGGFVATLSALGLRSFYLLGSGLLVITLALSWSFRDLSWPIPKYPRTEIALLAVLCAGSVVGMAFPWLAREHPSISTLEFLYGWYAIMGGLMQLGIAGIWTVWKKARSHPATSSDQSAEATGP